MTDTIHRAKVSLVAGLYGLVDVMNKCVMDPLWFFVLSMYHFRVRTGHQSLSADSPEREVIAGTKISGGSNDEV